MQTDGQVEAVATPKPSYASVATQAALVPTGPRNETSGVRGLLRAARGLSL